MVVETFRLVGGGDTLPSSVANLLRVGGGIWEGLLASQKPIWKTLGREDGLTFLNTGRSSIQSDKVPTVPQAEGVEREDV